MQLCGGWQGGDESTVPRLCRVVTLGTPAVPAWSEVSVPDAPRPRAGPCRAHAGPGQCRGVHALSLCPRGLLVSLAGRGLGAEALAEPGRGGALPVLPSSRPCACALRKWSTYGTCRTCDLLHSAQPAPSHTSPTRLCGTPVRTSLSGASIFVIRLTALLTRMLLHLLLCCCCF